MTTEPTHALYRFYADDGALLYVGITNNPGNRWPQHQADKPWWHEVRGISLEVYDDRASVLAAEKRAIRVEKPRYNKIRSKPASRGQATPALRPLVWVCDHCRNPVADGAGYIHVRHADVQETQQAERAWRQEHEQIKSDTGLVLIPASAYEDFPAPARWQVHHRLCDPDPESFDYHFDVARARTHARLLHWTAHLFQKSWMQDTDWLELIDRMAEVDA